MPVGIFANAFVDRTKVSATNTITAEIIPDAINKNLLSQPIIFLAICGPIRPKKKKFPPNATEDDDNAIAENDKNKNSFLTLTPKPFAISYPKLIAFNVLAL